MQRSARLDVVCFVGANAKRDAIIIELPKPISKKEIDSLSHAVARTARNSLTARKRRPRKR